MSSIEQVPGPHSGSGNVTTTRLYRPPARRSTTELVVSVGTDHHRFDRLIGWIDDWRDLHPDVVAVVQAGTSAPSRHDCRELIPHGELLELFRGATVVVSHGGPSTVMDARMSGRLPIVVARNPAYHEHIDEHQMRFAEHLARHGVAVVVDNRDDLFAVLDQALADPDAFSVAADHGNATGVTSFARAVDSLIGTRTPLEQPPPASADTGRPAESTGSPAFDRRSSSAPYPLVDRRRKMP